MFINTRSTSRSTSSRTDTAPAERAGIGKIRTGRGERARHRAGRHPEGRPGQNTCIFSTEFSLKVMGDIQEYFVQHKVRNFYSVSISGYHIAEAGGESDLAARLYACPNGFTFVEAYLARGMDIDDFAPNLSFSFSTAWTRVCRCWGRVARRIWATTMRDKYGANERSQKTQVSRADIRPLAARAGDRLQRHPHPRCRL
jgi:hypothetical protein